MRSIRFFNRARTDRGFVLVAALTLAILYFALMELLLVDSSRQLAEARRFRSRVMAAVVAENAAELAAQGMVGGSGRSIDETNEEGVMKGQFRATGGNAFEIEASGETRGTERQSARVFVQGRIESGGVVKIDYTMHNQ
ncbi:MAG TPA: hypothetical protein VF057_08065 [Thermoanaerobaculia bacterium]